MILFSLIGSVTRVTKVCYNAPSHCWDVVTNNCEKFSTVLQYSVAWIEGITENTLHFYHGRTLTACQNWQLFAPQNMRNKTLLYMIKLNFRLIISFHLKIYHLFDYLFNIKIQVGQKKLVKSNYVNILFCITLVLHLLCSIVQTDTN